MATQTTEIRRALVEAIKAVQCRPRKHVNFPNDPDGKLAEGLPRMDVQWLSAPITGTFTNNTTLVSQLVQIDFYIAKGVNLEEIEGYVDAFRQAFPLNTRVATARVSNPPAILLQAADPLGYRTSISFALEYRVKAERS
ncbi:MAG: hypothetical protein K0U66_04210 [Gammaproteobacteria bacterium]|nr:hypothetical protein [Gammaproteobacteria bacterium]